MTDNETGRDLMERPKKTKDDRPTIGEVADIRGDSSLHYNSLMDEQGKDVNEGRKFAEFMVDVLEKYGGRKVKVTELEILTGSKPNPNVQSKAIGRYFDIENGQEFVRLPTMDDFKEWLESRYPKWWLGQLEGKSLKGEKYLYKLLLGKSIDD